MMRKHTGIFCAVLVLLSCRTGVRTGEEAPLQVRGIEAGLRKIPDEVSGFGSLSYLTKIDVAAPQDARILRIRFREGDRVNRGDLLVELENPQFDLALRRAEDGYAQVKADRDLAYSRLLEGEFRAEAEILGIEKAEMELIHARKNYEEDVRKFKIEEALFDAGGVTEEEIRSRNFELENLLSEIALMEKELSIRRVGLREQDLLAAGIVSGNGDEPMKGFIEVKTLGLRAELASAEARLLAAQRELESAKIALEEFQIRSPADAVVGARYLEEGERVKREDKILTVMNTASFYAVFPVRESEAMRIEKGMPARVLVEGDGSGIWREGLVDLVYPQADSQSLSLLVRVLLPSPEGEDRSSFEKLKPGMFVRSVIRLGEGRQAVVIKETSILKQDEQTGSVFVIKGGVLSTRKVELGMPMGEEREIRSGLNAGEVAVERPESGFREGIHVVLE
jgi:RND family efflux transporter MFP subunit